MRACVCVCVCSRECLASHSSSGGNQVHTPQDWGVAGDSARARALLPRTGEGWDRPSAGAGRGGVNYGTPNIAMVGRGGGGGGEGGVGGGEGGTGGMPGGVGGALGGNTGGAGGGSITNIGVIDTVRSP